MSVLGAWIETDSRDFMQMQMHCLDPRRLARLPLWLYLGYCPRSGIEAEGNIGIGDLILLRSCRCIPEVPGALSCARVHLDFFVPVRHGTRTSAAGCSQAVEVRSHTDRIDKLISLLQLGSL